MATYFSASNDQKDIMPALYLRESSRPAYPDSTIPSNMLYMNFSPTGSYVGDSSSVLISQSTASHHDIMPNMANPRMQEHPYGIFGRNDILCNAFRGIPSVRQVNNTNTVVSSGGSNDSHMGIGRPLNIIRGNNFPLHQSNMLAMQGQGLSLSLSTLVPSSIPVPAFQLGHGNSDIPFMCSHQSTSGEGSSGRENNLRFEHQRNPDIAHAIAADNPTTERSGAFVQLHTPPNFASFFPNSKYLKAAQQLLDEVVNVNRALKQESNKQQKFHASGRSGECKEGDGKLKDEETCNQPESTVNSESKLSPSEKQDLQNKMAKLLCMLDEVDKKYRQYYLQMEMVMSSFDEIAGPGAAKPYTALALQTISQHFRCLRDAITKQIQITKRSLGEQDTLNGKSSGGLSRLRLIDQQLRQQKSFQQFGMVQQHTWRPQRGLPENSVSILRSWLFEHFLHPYPKDSDKLMLARQTGLTRSQVSNWFINARVRLWKPMVEEMYKEEIGDTEIDSISSSDNASKIADKSAVHEDREESQCLTSEPIRSIANQLNEAKSDISDVQMGGTTSEFQNGTHGKENKEILKRGNDQGNTDECCFLQDTFVQSDGTGRFMTYQMAELGRFGNGDVSLTLGLHHCDGNLPVSGSQQNFAPIRGEEMYNDSSAGVDMHEYDCMSLSNQRNRFNSPHLLHDFVA